MFPTSLEKNASFAFVLLVCKQGELDHHEVFLYTYHLLLCKMKIRSDKYEDRLLVSLMPIDYPNGFSFCIKFTRSNFMRFAAKSQQEIFLIRNQFILYLGNVI